MRPLAFALAGLLAAATACGKYGPPVRTVEPKPAAAKPAATQPAPAQPDTEKTQDPNAPAPAPAPGATP